VHEHRIQDPEVIAAAHQAARAVLMVRPARFAWNPQTQASNRFQRGDASLAAAATERARAEFDGLVESLEAAGVRTHIGVDATEPACPDAVFPNNWVSLHADGTVVLYPMLAPNRRLERRPELLTMLVEQGYHVQCLIDLTHYEMHGQFLEGTGSVVFDHAQRVAFACLSPRTHLEPLRDLCAELGYTPCTFTATDAAGVPVYHTNVVLAIGTRCAVVATDMIARHERDAVIAMLARGGRTLVSIDASQVAHFAGNVLELRAADGSSVLALSQQARDALRPSDLELLQRSVDRIASAPVATIETLGGGSVRCMLAEVFLPR
jgi:hypothetical protein